MALVFKQASQSGATPPDYGAAIRNITEQLKSLDKELGDYFTSTALYEGGLSVVDGELAFNSTSQLPTFNEAWSSYKDIYERNGQTAGMNAYQQFKTVYSDMTKMYGNQLANDIKKYSNAGYSTRSIRNALGESNVYLSNLNTLISDPANGGQYAAALADYTPKKSLFAGMQDSPGTLGAGILATGVGAGVAYKGLSGIPEDTMDAAKTGYKGKLESARDILNKANADADKLVDNVKKSKDYKKLDGRSKAAKNMISGAKQSAEQLKSEALEKFRQTRGGLEFSPKTRGGKIASMIGKTPNIAKGVGYAAVPMMIEGAITELTDNTDAGQIGGEAAAASMTTAQAIQSGAKLKPAVNAITSAFKKHGTAKILREVMKKGGMGLAARTLAKAGAGTVGGVFTGGAMTALMAAWSLKDLYDISQIIADM
jgi:hypothetical protein